MVMELINTINIEGYEHCGARLYWMDTRKLEEADCFLEYYDKMSQERRRKIDACLLMQDKRLSLVAGILMDYGLSFYGLREKEQTVVFGKNGKPYLSRHPGLYFNLSYSKDLVIAVFAGVETGCDIAKVQEADLALAEKFFTPSEYKYIAGQPGRELCDQAFYRLWALKESFAKAVGEGMMIPLHLYEISILADGGVQIAQDVDQAVYGFREFDILGYCAAVCFREKRRQ